MGTTSHAREPPPAVASPKLLDRIAIPVATTGRVAAIWKQLGANIGPQRRNARGLPMWPRSARTRAYDQESNEIPRRHRWQVQ